MKKSILSLNLFLLIFLSIISSKMYSQGAFDLEITSTNGTTITLAHGGALVLDFEVEPTAPVVCGGGYAAAGFEFQLLFYDGPNLAYTTPLIPIVPGPPFWEAQCSNIWQISLPGYGVNIPCDASLFPSTIYEVKINIINPFAFTNDGIQVTSIPYNFTNLPFSQSCTSSNNTFPCSMKIADATIVSTPLIITSTSSTNESCPNINDGTASVTSSGGMSPVTYLWDDPLAQTTSTATGLAAGNYNVTVTGGFGCVVSATVTVGSDISATTLGTHETCPNDGNGSILATINGGVGPFSFSWNDPAMQTTNPAINLSAGNYTVTITDAGSGCVFSVTDNVFSSNYTHPNGIIISSNTTWSGQNFKINGPVFIEDNATLTIDGGSIVEFGPQGIIRNNQFSSGGLRNITNPLILVVDNATLTGLSGCSDNFWKGIDITGEVVLNNSTIENAQTAANIHDVFDLGNGSFLVSGKLDAINTTFRNNQDAIVMNSTLNSGPGNQLLVNGAVFENTSSIPSSFTNKVRFITIRSNSFFSITNSSFNNNAVFSGTNRPIGINYFAPSIGFSSYTIENNMFTDLQEAIIVRNSRVMQIKTNTFTATDRGILLQGGRLDLVENNNFNIADAFNNETYGVRLIGTSGADVKNNFFTGTGGNTFESYGIIAENTGTGAGLVFDNQLQGIDIGIQTQGDNPALKIRCNNFAADGNPHNIAGWTTLVLPSAQANTLRPQGSSCQGTSGNNINENQAGNEWLDNCGAGLSDVVVDNSIFFPYFAHQEVNATSLETTQPTCSSPLWATNNISNICNSVNKTNTSCNSPFAGLVKDPNIDFEGYVIEVRNLMLLLQQQADSLKEILAEGNAPTLFTAISTLSSGDLKNLLLAASPYLSDEVLITYILSSPPAGNLQQIIVANSPVSERVKQVLDGTVLPKGIKKNINNAQVGVSSRTLTEFQIAEATGEVQLLANDLERRFSQNADRPREKQLLIDLNDVEAQKRLSEVLLGEENTTDSKVIIDAMLQDTTVSSVDENLHFCNLMTCLINAADQDRTLQQLTPSEMQTIVTVAFSPTQVAEKAQGVLTAIAQQNFAHPIAKIPTGNNLRLSTSQEENLDIEQETLSFNVYPNPSSGIFTLTPSKLVEELLQVKIYSVLGEEILAQPLSNANINLSAYNNGIYFVRILNAKGKEVFSTRFILQK